MAKPRHNIGLRRAVRRGLFNVAIQVYLTAAVMNLKRLAKASIGPFHHRFYITKCLASDIYKALSIFGEKYHFFNKECVWGSINEIKVFQQPHSIFNFGI